VTDAVASRTSKRLAPGAGLDAYVAIASPFELTAPEPRYTPLLQRNQLNFL
jgi:hypothetical protein